MVRYMNPEVLGEPVGLYSHVAIDERTGLVFIAGQLAVSADLEAPIVDDFGHQLTTVLDNLKAAVDGAGSNMRSICQMTTYLTTPRDIDDFYQHRARLFPTYFGGPPYPPNTLIVADHLVRAKFRVEIQAIASLA